MSSVAGTASESASAGALSVPFDLEAALARAGWRQRLYWPVTPGETHDLLQAQTVACLAHIAAAGEADRDLLLLAAVRMLGRVRAMTVAALCLHRAAADGVAFAGGPPEIAWLDGAGDGPPDLSGALVDLSLAPVSFAFARRVARARTWTPWPRLAGAVLAPQAEAISHNALLRDAAAGSGRRIGFRQAQSLLIAARAAAPERTDGARVADMAAALADTLAPVAGIGADIGFDRRDRLRRLITAEGARALAQAARDAAGMARVKRLPRELWAGSLGQYASRVAAVEVRRRGGTVVAFDHGGTTPMTTAVQTVALVELAAADRLVVPTAAAADLVRAGGAPDLVRPYGATAISGHVGDPGFAAMSRLPPPPTPAGGRRRVMYVPNVLMQFRQNLPPLLPAHIYLDQQLTIAALLQRLPVDLLCKPAPEGLMPGPAHPLFKVAPCIDLPFEEAMAQADLFVLDLMVSTTFWRAVCSDRPVVFIDNGQATPRPEVRPLLEARCRIVRAGLGPGNATQIDADALEDAVMAAPRTADPTTFRHLLAGDA